MDNLSEYILSVQNYKKGRYDFKINSTPEKIKKAVEAGIPDEVKNAVINGNKFICIEEGSIGSIVLGAALILVWVLWELFINLMFGVLSIPMDDAVVVLSAVMFIIFVSLGLLCIGLGLLILRKPFIVLGKDGMVYKLRTGGVKAYVWEDISIEFFEYIDKYGQYKNLIRISLTGSSNISLGIDESRRKGRFYYSKELPDKKLIGRGHVSRLLFLTFFAYYNYGKYRKFNLPDQLRVKDKFDVVNYYSPNDSEDTYLKNGKVGTAESPKLEITETEKDEKINNSLRDLKEAYNNHKRINSSCGHYTTEEQIQNAYMDGKIFVLKGGNTIFLMTCPLMVFVAVSMIVLMDTYYYGFVFFACGIVTLFICLIGLIMKRNFLVIGPSGVFYRRIIKTGYFDWSNVTVIEGKIVRMKPGLKSPPLKTAYVTILLPNGEKIRFASMGYRNKEFTSGAKFYMFIRLFQIYSELEKN